MAPESASEGDRSPSEALRDAGAALRDAASGAAAAGVRSLRDRVPALDRVDAITERFDRLTEGSLGDGSGGVRERAREAGPGRRAVLALAGAAGAGFLVGDGGLLTDLRVLWPGASVANRDVAVRGGEAAAAVRDLVPAEDATHRAVRSGPWDEPLVWDGGVPDDGATVHITEGAEVTLRHQSTARLDAVRVDGALVFDPNEDTHLQAGTVVTTQGSHLQVGTPDDPVGPDVEARVTFLDHGPIDETADPERLGRGLLTLGSVSVRGATKTPWTALARAPTAGDTKLHLPSAPTNWQTGDRVVVPGRHPDENQDDGALIERVDGKRVHLDRPLANDHVPPADDLGAYVLNLTRSVTFRSESTDVPRRGHLMFMATGTRLAYAEMVELGRTDKSYPFTNPAHGTPPEDVPPNPRARYACHFHRTGIDASDPHRVEGCVVDGSPGWGFVNHHGLAHVTDSISHRVFGAGFVAEAGDERGSFRRNFALRSEGSGELLDSREFHSDDDDPEPGEVDDFGHGGHGFWLQGPAVAVEDNVAAGHRYYGFVFWNRPLIDRALDPGEKIDRLHGTVANFPLEHVDGMEPLRDSDHVQDGKVSSAYVPLRSVKNNTVFASGGGMDISRHQFGWDHTRVDEWGVVEGLTAHDIGSFTTHWGKTVEPDFANRRGGNAALCIRYSNNLRVTEPRFVSGLGRAGVGLNRNVPYPFHVSVEGGSIEGFRRGLHAMVRGVTRVTGTRLANIRNLIVEEEHRYPTRRVQLNDLTFEGGGNGNVVLELDDLEHLSPHELFGASSGVTLDGRRAFFPEQRPGYVPVPDRAALDALGGHDHVAELTGGSADDVVGKSNRQLWREYGFATQGRPTPRWAGSDDRVTGSLETEGHASRHQAWWEAESGDPEYPWTVEESESASGGAYITTTGVDGTGEPPSEGHATYDVDVAGGEYRLWGRFRAPTGEDDSVWVRVDGGDWHRWSRMWTDRGWRWFPLWDHDADRPMRLPLDGGNHTVTLAFREDGTQVDKLALTTDEMRPALLGESTG